MRLGPAVLPVRWDALAASAFLSSLAATASAVNLLFTPSHASPIQKLRALACNNWASSSGHSLDDQPQSDLQRTWDEAICRKQFTALLLQLLVPQGLDFLLVRLALLDAGWLHSLHQPLAFSWATQN